MTDRATLASADLSDGRTPPDAPATSHALNLGVIKPHGGSERITRRPTQPRSNLERFNRGCKLAMQLEEAADMSSSGRHKVWDEIGAEVTELLKELLGDSLVKIEREGA